MEGFLLSVATGFFLWWYSIKPSHTRKWAPDQLLLPWAEIRGDEVRVKNIRHFVYESETDYVPGYYDQSFLVSQLRRVYFLFTPFKQSRYGAHGFFSFEFAGGDYLSVSVEIRKKHTDKYSALKGLFKQYELMYVVADERDVVQLRTHCRENEVFMYPLRLRQKEGQALFMDIMRRVNMLAKYPEFYNTLGNACVVNLARHLNVALPRERRVPFNWRLIVSGFADRYLHGLGLFDTDLPYEEAREAFYISERARLCGPAEEFSRYVRNFFSS